MKETLILQAHTIYVIILSTWIHEADKYMGSRPYFIDDSMLILIFRMPLFFTLLMHENDA